MTTPIDVRRAELAMLMGELKRAKDFDLVRQLDSQFDRLLGGKAPDLGLLIEESDFASRMFADASRNLSKAIAACAEDPSPEAGCAFACEMRGIYDACNLIEFGDVNLDVGPFGCRDALAYGEI